jgi:broad specificity phosphatase PhoE
MWIRHAHGFHQIGYEAAKKGMAQSPVKALGIDIPNHQMPLSPFGIWQAEQTHLAFEAMGFEPDCVYGSQMFRAQQTANIIFPGHRLKIDPRLNEKDFAVAHMLSDEELIDLYPLQFDRYKRDGKYFAPYCPGGENYPMMFLRLHSLLDTLRRDWAGRKVAILSHAAVMLVVRQLFEHHQPDELVKLGSREEIANCGILHYGYPNKLYGWQKGRFRVNLVRSPYRLWDDPDGSLEEKFWQEAIANLPKLKEEFS